MIVEELQLLVLDREVFLQAARELVFIHEVADADADAVVTIYVAWADAAVRRADFALAASLVTETIHEAMIGQHDMSAVRDADTAEVDATRGEIVHLLQHDFRIEGHAVAHDAMRTLIEDARRHEAKLVCLAIDDDRMAGIAAALIAHDRVGLLCQVVDNLALAFIAPLRTGNYYCRHKPSPLLSLPARQHSNDKKRGSKTEALKDIIDMAQEVLIIEAIVDLFLRQVFRDIGILLHVRAEVLALHPALHRVRWL